MTDIEASQTWETGRSLDSVVRDWIGGLNDKERTIVTKRLSVPVSHRLTLQQIADDLGITRARVQQLEARALKRLRATEAPLVSEIVAGVLERLGCAAPVSRVEIEDYRLNGLTRHQWVLEMLLKAKLTSDIAIVPVGGISHILAMPALSWTSLVGEARSAALSMQSLDDPPPVDVVEAAIRAFGPPYCAALQKILVQVVLENSVIASAKGAQRVLVAMERTTDSEIRAILTASPRPIHFTEVNKRLGEVFNSQRDERTVHNACARADGVYLLDRGTFGLRQHIDISDSEAAQIGHFVDDLISSDETDRQWHGNELLAEVMGAFPDIRLGFGEYELAFIIETRCSALRSLGRMVYQRTDAPLRSRIDYRQAITSILRDAGRPLRDDDLLARLAEYRGLSKYALLLLPSEEYARMDGGRVGLIDRDFGLDPHQMTALVDKLLMICEQAGKGIHKSQVAARLRIDETRERFAAQGVIAHARRDSRLRISTSGYLFPATWDGPRRPSIAQAVKNTIASLPDGAEWTSHDLVESVVISTGQKHLTHNEISSVLSKTPHVAFDIANQRWRRTRVRPPDTDTG